MTLVWYQTRRRQNSVSAALLVNRALKTLHQRLVCTYLYVYLSIYVHTVLKIGSSWSLANFQANISWCRNSMLQLAILSEHKIAFV